MTSEESMRCAELGTVSALILSYRSLQLARHVRTAPATHEGARLAPASTYRACNPREVARTQLLVHGETHNACPPHCRPREACRGQRRVGNRPEIESSDAAAGESRKHRLLVVDGYWEGERRSSVRKRGERRRHEVAELLEQDSVVGATARG